MEAIILGCGEAFDATLPNTSILLRSRATFLLDCGFSAVPQVWKEVADPNEIDVVFISHAHADHYFGLPALLTRMWEDGRTRPLVIVSQPGVLAQIPVMLDMAYRGVATRFQYPIEYRAAVPGHQLDLCEARLSFAATNHSAPNLAVRVEEGGKRFCYSGDGMFTEGSRALFGGADLLVHEAYKFEENPVHTEIGQLLRMAAEQRVRKLALVHVQRGLRARPNPIQAALVGLFAVETHLPEPLNRIGV